MIKGKKETEFEGVDRPWLKEGSLGLPPTKKPCQECPLRKQSAPGYLGGYTVEQYLMILHSDAAIACHMSPGFPKDHSQQRHCTGVQGYRNNVSKKPRSPALQEAQTIVGKSPEFFESPQQFMEHHKAASEVYRAIVKQQKGK